MLRARASPRAHYTSPLPPWRPRARSSPPRAQSSPRSQSSPQPRSRSSPPRAGREAPRRPDRDVAGDEPAKKLQWTPAIENMVTGMRDQAQDLAWMHESMGANAKRWDDALNIVSGVLGAIIGASGAISIAANSSVWNLVLQIILGIAVAIVSALSTTWRLGEIRKKCAVSHAGFITMARDLEWQLVQPREDREDVKTFVEAKRKENEQLAQASEPLGEREWRLLEKRHRPPSAYIPGGVWDPSPGSTNAQGNGVRSAPLGLASPLMRALLTIPDDGDAGVAARVTEVVVSDV